MKSQTCDLFSRAKGHGNARIDSNDRWFGPSLIRGLLEGYVVSTIVRTMSLKKPIHGLRTSETMEIGISDKMIRQIKAQTKRKIKNKERKT
jgi:hypothetical protein